MQNEANIDQSDEKDPWEEKCRMELEIRDAATKIFGKLSDLRIRQHMVKFGILFSSDNKHEEWSRLLDASLVAEAIRQEIGLKDPFYRDLPATKEMEM